MSLLFQSRARPSSQRRSPLPSLNKNDSGYNDNNTRRRYDNYNAGYLVDKPRSPPEIYVNEDACNNTFDMEDERCANDGYGSDFPSQQDYMRSMTVEKGRGQPLRSLSSHRLDRRPVCRSPSVRSAASRSGDSVHSQRQFTRGATRNVSPERAIVTPPREMTPVTPQSPTSTQGLALRTGRTYQDYVDAQAFAKDLTESRGPQVKRPMGWPKRADGGRPPAPLRPKTASRGDANDNALLPTPMPVPQMSNNLEHVNRIGNRDQILASNMKIGGAAKRVPGQSGIPVRAL